MLCRDLNFWETYCMIEGRFHLIGYHRKNGHISKKGVPHVLSILQGYSFLKEAMPFLEGKLQFMNDGWNVYSDMQIFCQGHETHCKISRQKNSSKTKLWEKSDALLMQFWCSFDAIFKTASKLHQNCIKLMQFWCSFQNCIKTASKLHQNCIRFFRIFSDVLQDFLRFPSRFSQVFQKNPQPQKWTKRVWKVFP